MSAIDVNIVNPIDWTPETNLVEMVVSNRRARQNPEFAYTISGLLEDVNYRMCLKLEMTDNMKYKYCRERKTWFPQSLADQKEPIFMEHHEGFQTGGYWNQEGVHFKQFGYYPLDSYGQEFEYYDTTHEFVTKSPASVKRKQTTDESMQPVVKKGKGNEAQYNYKRKDEETTETTAKRTREVSQYEHFNYEQVQQEEYYDWRIDTSRVQNQYAPRNHQLQEPVEPVVYSLDDYFSMQ
uniref:T-box domain-containing protein n=1 Tax=Caenorhabditis tropicalis TaxID=1561998 RepID=A0A1I7T1I0_9PELO